MARAASTGSKGLGRRARAPRAVASPHKTPPAPRAPVQGPPPAEVDEEARPVVVPVVPLPERAAVAAEAEVLVLSLRTAKGGRNGGAPAGAVKRLRALGRRLRDGCGGAAPPEARRHWSALCRLLGTVRDVDAVAETLAAAVSEVDGKVKRKEKKALHVAARNLRKARGRALAEARSKLLRRKGLQRALAAAAAVTEERPEEAVQTREPGALGELTCAMRAVWRLDGEEAWSLSWEKLTRKGPASKKELRRAKGDALQARLLGCSSSRAARLHELRKSIRNARFALQALLRVSPPSIFLSEHVDWLIRMQGALGTMHDVEVVAGCLHEYGVLKRMPAVSAALRARHKAAFATFAAERDRFHMASADRRTGLLSVIADAAWRAGQASTLR